jgi:hypothetical protein
LEATSKKGGRPKIHAESIATMRGMGAITVRTNRAALNRMYCYDAIAALGIGGGLFRGSQGTLQASVHWPAADRYERGALKVGVLAEIARAALQFGQEVAILFGESINDMLADGRVASAKAAETQVRAWRQALAESQREQARREASK